LFLVIAEDYDKQGEVLFKQHHISTTQALAMSDWLLDVDARVMGAIQLAKQRGFVSTGDAVVVVTGWVRNYSIRTVFLIVLLLASGHWYNKYITCHLCGLKLIIFFKQEKDNLFKPFPRISISILLSH